MRRFIFPCFLAMAGSIWLMWAFPRFHPAARLGLTMDREGYIAQARGFALSRGVNTTEWGAETKAETETKQQQARENLPGDEVVRAFPPGEVTTNLTRNDGGSAAGLTVRPDGRMLGWELPTPQTKLPGEPKVLAESALRELAGNDASHYQITDGGTPEKRGWLYAWERTEETSDPAHSHINVHVENGRVKKTESTFTIPDGWRDRMDRFPVLRVVAGFTWFFLLIASLILAIMRDGAANALRSMKERSALWLSALIPVMVLISSSSNWGRDPDESKGSQVLIAVLAVFLGACILGLLFYSVLAATVLNARMHPGRVRGLRLLGTKAFYSRLVGEEILGGLLCAPALVAIPLAISAMMRVSAYRGYADGLLLSRLPLLNTLADLADQETLTEIAFLGILVPAAMRISSPRWLPAKWLRWSVISIAALATFAMLVSPFRQDMRAQTATIVLTAALVVWLYTGFGVLGALTATCASRILVAAGALMVQQARGLQWVGVETLIALGCAGLFALIAAWRGPQVTTQLFGESGLATEPRTRREELLAEFNVARSAQQQMLPARAPVLPGYTIAATCEPAREVGGDLYDFLRLRDGRVGIGVADVSGKGVPAALYMTLTKGLLCAASQDSSDPHEILAAVNTHLHEAVRKKMFVTMSLGALDMEARTLEHVRAGHNPIVWRRAALGETRMLATSGMALGMTGPKLFSKTLAAETILLAPGDALVFYSDGLTEAMDESLEQFGDDRLMAAVERADGLPAEATRDSILSEVKDFLHGGQSQDDLTIAVVRVSDGR